MTITTNVPAPSFGPRGFVVPAESDVLAGVQADQQAAFGGKLNPALNTPQGQLAQSEAAIIGDKNNQFVALANGVDPAFAAGRMQDAIGRIYFIDRIAAAPTVVIATCVGLQGVVIPVGAQAAAQDGNVYLCTEQGTIPVGGSIDLPFACSKTGPIACPTGFLNSIYRAIPGWDTVANAAGGTPGNDVESRVDFEFRRAQSVALNAQGSLPSVLGAVLDVDNVLDAYATENVLSVTSGAAFTGSIAGTTLTVTAVSNGTIASDAAGSFQGQIVVGAGIAQGTSITARGSGTGGTGTYVVSISQSVSSESVTCAVGGVRLVANSLYVAAVGGLAQDVAQAIWTKKSPGCNYNGNTTETVVDSGSGYTPPFPSYQVTFETPPSVAIKFAVTMQTNPSVPSNAIDLIKAAIQAAFVGADDGPRVRIGSLIPASRFYAGIATLGTWASNFTVKVGVAAATQDAVLMRIDQSPTLSLSDIAVTIS